MQEPLVLFTDAVAVARNDSVLALSIEAFGHSCWVLEVYVLGI